MKNDKLIKEIKECKSLVEFYKKKEAILKALGVTPKKAKKDSEGDD